MSNPMAYPVPPTQPRYKDTNHTLHLILSVVTLGCWLFVWPCVAAANSASNGAKSRRYDSEMRDYQQQMAAWQSAQQGGVR